MESTQGSVLEPTKKASQTIQNCSFIECIPIKQIEIVINLENFLSPEELKRWMELPNT